MRAGVLLAAALCLGACGSRASLDPTLPRLLPSYLPDGYEWDAFVVMSPQPPSGGVSLYIVHREGENVVAAVSIRTLGSSLEFVLALAPLATPLEIDGRTFWLTSTPEGDERRPFAYVDVGGCGAVELHHHGTFSAEELPAIAATLSCPDQPAAEPPPGYDIVTDADLRDQRGDVLQLSAGDGMERRHLGLRVARQPDEARAVFELERQRSRPTESAFDVDGGRVTLNRWPAPLEANGRIPGDVSASWQMDQGTSVSVSGKGLDDAEIAKIVAGIQPVSPEESDRITSPS